MKNNRKKIVVALGSNVEQEVHIGQAKKMLTGIFEGMTFGKEMWTEPIGMASDKFLNVLGIGFTDASKESVLHTLKDMERRCGRIPGDSQKGIVAVDIDLLLFDTERFHEEDWERPYIQQQILQMGMSWG